MKKVLGILVLFCALVMPLGGYAGTAAAAEDPLLENGCWHGNPAYPLWTLTEMADIFADLSSVRLSPEGEIFIDVIAVRRVGEKQFVETKRFNSEGSCVFNDYTKEWLPFEKNESYRRLWLMADEELTMRGDIKG